MLVGRAHAAWEGSIDISRHAPVAPEPRISAAEAHDRDRREVLEGAHVPLEYLDHLTIGVAPRGRAELGLPHGRLGVALEHVGDGIEDLLLLDADRKPDIGLEHALAGHHVHLEATAD